MFNVGSVVAHIRADTSQFIQGINQARDQVASLSDNAKMLGRNMQSLGGRMTAFVTTPIVGLGIAAVKGAADMEQLHVAFSTMLGDADRASALLNEISDFALKTPFQLKDVQVGAKQLLAYGVSADDVLTNLQQLGDIAAGVGMDKLPNLILAFGQVKAATRLTGMELRQFTEAGVPLLDELANVMGKPVSEVQELVSAGQVGFPIVEEALRNLTGEGGRFFNLMEQQSQTTAGQWSNLQDSASKLGREIGAVLLPYVNQFIQYLLRLVEWFRQLNPEVQKWTLIIIGVIAVLGPLILVIGTLIVALTTIIPIIVAVGGVIAALGAPVLILGGIIVAFAILVISRWNDIKENTLALWNIITTKFNQGVNLLRNIGGRIYDAIVSPFVNAWNRVQDLMNKIKDALDFTKRHSPSVVDIVNKGVYKVNKAMEGLDMGIQSTGTVRATLPVGAGVGGSISNIQINLDGAVIADDRSAMRIGEQIGNSIIRKLKLNVKV